MLKLFVPSAGRVEQRDCADPGMSLPAAVWFDLMDPTPAEIKAVESSLGLELPRREEMLDIELSSRLYQDGPALFMTVTLTSQADSTLLRSDAVTFIVTPSALVTLRYSDPKAFANFATWLQRNPANCASSEFAFLGLFEAIVDRIADLLERTAAEIETIGRGVFEGSDGKLRQGHALYDALRGIGRNGTRISSISESLLTLTRATAFFGTTAASWLSKEAKTRVKTLSRDVQSLHDHGVFLSEKVNFLLDATLGMINIEQNTIIKIFSVAAVAFLPPTLIASIYGMNFHEIPELGWSFGYPMAIVMMVLSSAIPFYYFKKRHWL
jgi:magnesium transporter